MTQIMIVASPGTFLVSVGAMLDAYARLTEPYVANPGMRDYSAPHLAMMLCAVDGSSTITLAGGRTLSADGVYTHARDVKMVYLPSFQIADPDELEEKIRLSANRGLHDWLSEIAASGIALGACGASVCHLAAAGLLDGKTAAVHPRLEHAFRTMFPSVRIASRQTVVRNETHFTCALDRDSHLVVEKMLECGVSPIVSDSLKRREPSDDISASDLRLTDVMVLQAKMWLSDHFAQPVRIKDLAKRFCVTHQTLIRRFRATGVGTPQHYLQQVRLESAAAMLEETRRPVSEIAQLVGYTDIASFRRKFRHFYGLSPTEHRKMKYETKCLARPSGTLATEREQDRD